MSTETTNSTIFRLGDLPLMLREILGDILEETEGGVTGYGFGHGGVGLIGVLLIIVLVLLLTGRL